MFNSILIDTPYRGVVGYNPYSPDDYRLV